MREAGLGPVQSLFLTYTMFNPSPGRRDCGKDLVSLFQMSVLPLSVLTLCGFPTTFLP